MRFRKNGGEGSSSCSWRFLTRKKKFDSDVNNNSHNGQLAKELSIPDLMAIGNSIFSYSFSLSHLLKLCGFFISFSIMFFTLVKVLNGFHHFQFQLPFHLFIIQILFLLLLLLCFLCFNFLLLFKSCNFGFRTRIKRL